METGTGNISRKGRRNNSSTTTDENQPTVGGGIEATNSGRSKTKQTIINDKENVVSISPTPKVISVTIPEGGQTESTPKEKKPRVPRTKKETGISQTEISNLICGCFSLISLKAGEHWQVSEDEAMQVAKPLENILKKMDLLEKVSNVSDGAMLVFAVASITLPRVLITRAMISETKKNLALQMKGGAIIGESIRTEETEVTNNIESSESNTERIKERKTLDSKHDDALYSTNAQ